MEYALAIVPDVGADKTDTVTFVLDVNPVICSKPSFSLIWRPTSAVSNAAVAASSVVPVRMNVVLNRVSPTSSIGGT